jgi:predicted patatin/cPLA2 family phospholipase
MQARERAAAPTTTHEIDSVALIFEGGGMRCANTAGVVCTLLEAGIHFKDVYGVSAGASHTVNYISRAAHRARASFVDFFAGPHLVGLDCLLTGRGYFNARAIYQEAGRPDGAMPFDFEAFIASGSQMHIAGFDATIPGGRTVIWTKHDTPTLDDLMLRVRASSTLPAIMPPVRIDGHVYYDGGLGDNWGVMLAAAQRDGYERFLIVCSQERGYRKKPGGNRLLARLAAPLHPIVGQRSLERWQHYNAIYGEVDELADKNEAYVYHPAHMPLKNTTREIAALEAAFEAGYAQAQAELPAIRTFLGI